MSAKLGPTVADRLQALVDVPRVDNVGLTVSGPVRLQMVDGVVRERPPITHSPTDELALIRLLTGAGDVP